MRLLWVVVDDAPGRESLRGFLERNAIVLLGNYGRHPLDPPSEEWLGRASDREKVSESGRWNQNHVDEDYDPAFLGRFETLIRDMAAPP